MKNLMKSVMVIGHVFGLFLGNDFTTPATEILERHPYLQYYL